MLPATTTAEEIDKHAEVTNRLLVSYNREQYDLTNAVDVHARAVICSTAATYRSAAPAKCSAEAAGWSTGEFGLSTGAVERNE